MELSTIDYNQSFFILVCMMVEVMLSMTLTFCLPRFHTQVQSRLERMGSGMLRLATGKKVMTNLPAMKQTTVHVEEYKKWLSTHTSIVRDLVDYQMTIYELVSVMLGTQSNYI